jgi:FAD:protein FMN transferase
MTPPQGTRRKFNLFLIVFFVFSGSLLFFSNFSFFKSREWVWQGETMGSSFTVKLASMPLSKKEFTQWKTDLNQMLVELNQVFSVYQKESEISLFNQSKITDSALKVSEPFFTAVRQALVLSEETEGFFDITVAPLVRLWGFGPEGFLKLPKDWEIQQALKKTGIDKLVLSSDQTIRKKDPDVEIDLNAIAQGFAADRIGQYLLKKNCRNFMVDVGGEFFCRGRNAQNALWKIGIETPDAYAFADSKIQTVVALHDQGLSTSGSYRRFIKQGQKTYAHILNPKTGKPAAGKLISVTVIAETATSADAYATALFAMGEEEALDWLKKHQNTEACFITKKQNGTFVVQTTKGFKRQEIS